jgi:hypothetical protein
MVRTLQADETYFGTINKDELTPPEPGKPQGKKRGIRRSAYRAVLALP